MVLSLIFTKCILVSVLGPNREFSPQYNPETEVSVVEDCSREDSTTNLTTTLDTTVVIVKVLMTL